MEEAKPLVQSSPNGTYWLELNVLGDCSVQGLELCVV